jgi:Uma2 family endonuclease
MHWLGQYQAHTWGTVVYDNTTLILGPDSEPQPDATLIIDPRCGGQTRVNEADYVVGPPELILEVASSSEAYDLHEKLRDYGRAGVSEYLIVMIRDQQVRWFYLQGDKYCDLPADAGGVFRSRVFPGLDLDVQALLALDSLKLRETLQRGLARPEHAALVRKLQSYPQGG